ncbi:hypothetical protein IFM89_000656 [Coptis chinensis]|uniref:Uncharacterized protein n=1 Tax=Coptis chinensis TaxID=261450 RepID=A0A835M6G3_9MAGN|nr:hypothetical protein IFM89_000656 [Coptis chinensis]
MGSTSVSVITPQEVLESLMNDGTIDAIRLKIINHLKANEELKNSTITMVEESKVLNSPGAEKHTKRELFDALRQELEVPALEKASKAVWELILDNDGIGKEINGTVERVFCRLSGRELPLFSPLITQVETDKVEENGDEIEGVEKETESLGKEKEDEGLDTSVKKKMKKRKRSVRVEEREVAVGSGDSPSVRDDSGKEINGTVERVFCRLSCCEPPLFPPSISEVENNKVKENESAWKEKEDEIEEKEEENETAGRTREYLLIYIQVE